MEVSTSPEPIRSLPTHARPSAERLALAGWAALIVVCAAWGEILLHTGTQLFINAPPLFGGWHPHLTPGVLVALGVAGALGYAGPLAARRLSWRGLLVASVGAAALWPTALALTAGAGSIAAPLNNPHDYLTVVPLIHSPGTFLSTFVDKISAYETHVKGHPPAMALLLWGLSRVGLGGAWPAAVLILSVAATAPAAALVAARAVAGEAPARRAAPFVVLAPAAVWIATSADALYMGVAAWAVALLVLAIVEPGRRRSMGLGLAGGLLFGLTCFFSFGLLLIGAIPLAVAIKRHRTPPLLWAAAGAAAVFGVFLAAGYWWLDGLAATRIQYYAGVASVRPFSYFAVADLAAFALATGPALALGLARLRDRRLWLLVGGCAAAIAVADLSGMSKGEVERIWLPFVPWMLLACAALPQGLRAQRNLLAGQVALALTLQIALVTNW